MKQNIFDEYVNILKAKIYTEKKFFSPCKKNCLILYRDRGVHNDILFCEFSVLFRDDDGIVEIAFDNSLVSCWYTHNVIYWSKDGNYCAISVSIKNKDKKIWFKEAKLIINLKNKLFTVVPLAGAREYRVKFIDNTVEISTGKADRNNEYVEIYKKAASLNIFKWLPLPEINKIHGLYNNGYFGDIAGYKHESSNIHFDGSKPEWPYKNTTSQ